MAENISRPLSDFIALVKRNGIARTNRFTVNITPPAVLSLYPPEGQSLRDMTLLCDATQLPGINISTTQARIFGEFREMPYEKLYDQLTLSFYVDSNLNIKKFFDDWQNSIQKTDVNGNRTMEYYDRYTSIIQIGVQDVSEELIYTCTLYEAYPKTVNAIALDYSSKEAMKLSVSFIYKYWANKEKRVVADTSPTSPTKTQPPIGWIVG